MRTRYRMMWVRLGATVLVGVVAGVTIASTAQGTPGAAPRLSVRSTEYGKALFGPSGKVLYVFGADRATTSRCYGVCATAWPPLLTKTTKTASLAGAGVQTRLLGTTKRNNGTLQVTYNGHPLYYYEGDKVGQVKCQHANMHGGLWLILKPTGQPNTTKGKMMHM